MAFASLLSRRPPDATASDGDLLDRFVRGNDQAAFAALVARHGPRVLGVCRRVLKDSHAADDAFQATFLVLAQKAGGLAQPEAVGSWLYGVALRTAFKARGATPDVGGVAPEPSAETDPTAGLAHEELRLVLDEELYRLPDLDRELIVLVYLEGKTHHEAARAAGCPPGSLAWRLTRARELLRSRLARRGVALSVGLLLLLASMGRAQAVTQALARKTVAAAPKPVPPAAGGSTLPVGCLVAAAAAVVVALLVWGLLGSNRGTPDPTNTPDAKPPIARPVDGPGSRRPPR